MLKLNISEGDKMEFFKKKKKNKLKDSIKKLFNKINIFKKKEVESYSFKEVLIVMCFSIGVGVILTISVINLISGGYYFKNSKDLNKLLEVYNTINDNYYGEIDNDKLISAAIDGMLSSVSDPYTTYIDEETKKNFLEQVNGEYEGIGCEIATTVEGDILVANVFSGSPADKGGLLKGDIIIKIDNIDYKGKTSNDVANYIKNIDKSKIEVIVLRNNQEKELIIKREKIEIPAVSQNVFEKNNQKIGYLNISIFSAISNKQFKTQLEQLEKSGINSLIIDVRDNSGGYLDSVTDICSMLLPKDKIIYKLEDANGLTVKYSTSNEHREYKIAVLINGNSASASEILAAAVKESYGGYVVGTNSYGKGTVQQTHNMSDGSMIKYTSQKWLTPLGNFINKIGVEPTNIVELNDNYNVNPTIDNDNQLQTAIELLSK